jgi:hypothetical protein
MDEVKVQRLAMSLSADMFALQAETAATRPEARCPPQER